MITKLNKAQLAIVEELAAEMQKRYPEWRAGQTYFNALEELFPGTANQIRATKVDPFYDDTRLESCKWAITFYEGN